MNDLLKTWYGLYPSWVDQQTFIYQNETYHIEDCFMTQKQMMWWLEVNERMMGQLGIGGFIPVRNLNGQIITQQKIVFKVKYQTFTLEHLFKQNQLIFSHQKTLLELREKWIEKVEFVNRRYLYEVDCHQNQYPFKMALLEYHVGLAKTAIEILNDLIYDYPSGISLNHLCHRRIPILDGGCCLNPMNLVMDNRARDLCELYMHQFIKFKDVIHYFETLHYSSLEMYYFCRVMYPSWLFDVVEEAYFKDEESKYNDTYFMNQMKFHLQAIKEVHQYVSQKIQMKPLEW